jgi:hypothetical protein
LFLLGGLLVFFGLLFGAGWFFLAADQESTEIRSQAAVNRSFQLLIESAEERAGGQRFDVFLSAESTDAVVTGFTAEITLLPSGAIAPAVPNQGAPAIPEARGPRQTLRQLLQKIVRVPIALAQTVSQPVEVTPAPTAAAIQVSSPLASQITFTSSFTRAETPPGSWSVKISGRAKAGQNPFSGRVKIAEINADTSGGRSFLARFSNQSVRGYLAVAPGAEVELTRLDPRGFACPAVVSERCQRGYRLGTEPTSGCLSCLRQRSVLDVIRNQPTPRPEYSCIQVYQPVCGENGQTYGNQCEAGLAGVKVVQTGVCL